MDIASMKKLLDRVCDSEEDRAKAAIDIVQLMARMGEINELKLIQSFINNELEPYKKDEDFIFSRYQIHKGDEKK